MTIKELINTSSIKALFAVFFNLSSDDDQNYFIVRSDYRKSIYSENNTNLFNPIDINNSINSYFNLNFVSDSFGRHILKIEKTQDINTADKLFKLLYRHIQLLSFDVETLAYEESILMALFALRGSVDFSAQYYTVDIYRQFSSVEYLRYIFQIISGTDAIMQLNLNFRELQPQYTAGQSQRNTQIRIKLGWFWKNYGNILSKINSYKYSLLLDNQDKIKLPTMRTGNFSDRLLEYMNNVLGVENNQFEIQKERQRLGLASDSTETRDFSIKTLASKIFADECMGCQSRFNKNSRTFKLRNQPGHYFEIHHVIPFSKGKEHDQIDNLAKLCPVCHRILTKNRAQEKLQKLTIKEILESSENARKYVGVLADTDDLVVLIDYVYEKLV